MNYNFCTLFDTGYLDKGLALYHSLQKQMREFQLYIYAFDKNTYEILEKEDLKNVTVVFIEDIETYEMLEAKRNRSRAEYCWTCTSIIIEYTLKNFNVCNCTYIDADIYFFQDPTILLSEIEEKKDSVLITKHNFTNTVLSRRLEKRCGTYCVEFNTFLNTEDGMNVLKWWKEQCLRCCTAEVGKECFGDQKYLNGWTEKFSGVHELQNYGGGVAPWNIASYQSVSLSDKPIIRRKETGITYPFVFYHFHELRDMGENYVNTNIYAREGRMDDKLVQYIYFTYLTQLVKEREYLKKKYGIEYPHRNQKQDKQIAIKEKSGMEEKITRSFADFVLDIYNDIVFEVNKRIRGKKDIISLDLFKQKQ